MAKLANNENVTVEVLAKICKALTDCTIDDIVDILPDPDIKNQVRFMVQVVLYH